MEPVCIVLSGHPVLSGPLSMSWFFSLSIIVILSYNKHHLLSPKGLFVLSSPVENRKKICKILLDEIKFSNDYNFSALSQKAPFTLESLVRAVFTLESLDRADSCCIFLMSVTIFATKETGYIPQAILLLHSQRYKCTCLFAGALYCSGILPLRILSSVLRQYIQHIVPGR